MAYGNYFCLVKRILFTLLLGYSFSLLHAQESKLGIFDIPDSLHKPRMIGVCAGQATVWVSSMIGLNNAWYANYPKSKFHFYDDHKEWLQVDKIGHGWSAYFGAQLSTGLFRWAGVRPKRAAAYGAGVGIAFVTLIEILDGYSKEWGFSVADISANTAGALLFSSQEIGWGEQRIQYKFSSHIKNYSASKEQDRANHLFGKSAAEKVLKDYNHQTYWLSVNVRSFAKKSSWPKWLNLAVGYGADGMYGGYTNSGIDKTTSEIYDFSYIPRIRQVYFSPDIDLSKIRWKGKTPALFKVIHALKLKFPMPAIEYNSRGQFRFHPLYF
jgi:hypothetical protein